MVGFLWGPPSSPWLCSGVAERGTSQGETGETQRSLNPPTPGWAEVRGGSAHGWLSLGPPKFPMALFGCGRARHKPRGDGGDAEEPEPPNTWVGGSQRRLSSWLAFSGAPQVPHGFVRVWPSAAQAKGRRGRRRGA